MIENAFNCLLDLEDNNLNLRNDLNVYSYNVTAEQQIQENLDNRTKSVEENSTINNFKNSDISLSDENGTPVTQLMRSNRFSAQRRIELTEELFKSFDLPSLSDRNHHENDVMLLSILKVEKGKKLVSRALSVLFPHHIHSIFLFVMRNLHEFSHIAFIESNINPITFNNSPSTTSYLLNQSISHLGNELDHLGNDDNEKEIVTLTSAMMNMAVGTETTTAIPTKITITERLASGVIQSIFVLSLPQITSCLQVLLEFSLSSTLISTLKTIRGARFFRTFFERADYLVSSLPPNTESCLEWQNVACKFFEFVGWEVQSLLSPALSSNLKTTLQTSQDNPLHGNDPHE